MSPYVPPATVQRGERRAALSVFLLLLAVYTATFSGLPDNPDAEVEFQTVSALWRRGALALGGTPEADAIVERRFDVAPGGPQRPGRLYSWFGVGQALVALPLYVVGRAVGEVLPEVERRHEAGTRMGAGRSEYFAHLAVGWRNPLLGACTGALLVLTARRLGVRRRAAWLTGLSYGLCTFAWPQARSTLSDVQATFLLFAAFHLLVVVRERFARLVAPSARQLALLGLALGGALLTRILTAPAVAVLFLASAHVLRFGHARLERNLPERSLPVRQRLPTQVLDLLVPFAACALLFLAVNWLRFGSPWETGYGAILRSGTFFSYHPVLGLAGLLASPGKGLLWMAPGLLLLPLALRHALRQEEHLWPWVLAGVALAVMAPVALTQTWHGAYTYGPRYLLPLLPFAWLGVGLALEDRRARTWSRPLAVGLWALGALVALPGVLVDHMTHQDLAVQAARVAWPDPPGAGERERDDARFLALQWDWRFAAPWAHWRILRHRVAGLGEQFPVEEIFLLDSDLVVEPGDERERGFRHLAWVDLSQRLDVPVWPALLGILALGVAGAGLGARALDRAT